MKARARRAIGRNRGAGQDEVLCAACTRSLCLQILEKALVLPAAWQSFMSAHREESAIRLDTYTVVSKALGRHNTAVKAMFRFVCAKLKVCCVRQKSQISSMSRRLR